MVGEILQPEFYFVPRYRYGDYEADGNNVEISPVEHREDFSDCRAEYLADPDLLAAVLRVEDDEPENADHRNENRQQAE